MKKIKHIFTDNDENCRSLHSCCIQPTMSHNDLKQISGSKVYTAIMVIYE